MVLLEQLTATLENTFFMLYERQPNNKDRMWIGNVAITMFHLKQYSKSRQSEVLIGDPLRMTDELTLIPLDYALENRHIPQSQLAIQYVLSEFRNGSAPHEAFGLIDTYMDRYVFELCGTMDEDYFTIGWDDIYESFALYNMGSVCGARYKLNMETR